MKNHLPHQIQKKQIYGLAILGIVITLAQIGFSFYKKLNPSEPLPEVHFIPEDSAKEMILADFNPNDLDEKQWQNLGFTTKEVQTILKYKSLIGGAFLSKEQFKKCYPIQSRYTELEPYILLPETHSKQYSTSSKPYQPEKKQLNITGKFNPDHFTAKDWEQLGFTSKQANAILRYKNYLGGSFQSKEKLKACYIINAEQFAQMSPYLLLPDHTVKVQLQQENKTQKINYFYFDPNELDESGWKALGFSEKQIAGIFNYKNMILKGSFRTLEDVEKCYMIQSRFAELKPWIRLNPILPKPSTEIRNNTDFSTINLNEITFKQLIEFGFNEKTARSFLAYRKSLGGFIKKSQIFEIYNIDRDLAEKLTSITQLNTDQVKTYTLIDAPESWLKTHPYFKYSADKIIYFRVSNPDDKKIWQLLKTSPEYEAKMKLYLK